jgi:hypothetical protein
MNAIVAVRRDSCENLVMVTDKNTTFKLMSEPSSIFVYAAVTECRTNTRGNDQRR